jgi:ribonuclease BN (tRNA processing enzyme)
MGSLQGKLTTIHDYFSVIDIEKNKSFSIGNDIFRLVQTVHVMNGYYIVPSFGLLISYGSKTIFITGDTQYAPEQINHFYEVSDLIFHDCELLYYSEGKPIYSTVHAHYEKLKTLPIEIKRKMWLTHYQDNIPYWCDSEKDGFRGFLRPGQVFD